MFENIITALLLFVGLLITAHNQTNFIQNGDFDN